jgi:hypothetical protein
MSRRHVFQECYVFGPESSTDSTTWHTELNRPLADETARGDDA